LYINYLVFLVVVFEDFRVLLVVFLVVFVLEVVAFFGLGGAVVSSVTTVSTSVATEVSVGATVSIGIAAVVSIGGVGISWCATK
jgi:hypothetical protein|tara:strand:- start:250 stop:501 length:252 start_codon:yes stop_codon:yes gene_type:complete